MTTIGLCCLIQRMAAIACEKKDYVLLYQCYKDFVKYAKLQEMRESKL